MQNKKTNTLWTNSDPAWLIMNNKTQQVLYNYIWDVILYTVAHLYLVLSCPLIHDLTTRTNEWWPSFLGKFQKTLWILSKQYYDWPKGGVWVCAPQWKWETNDEMMIIFQWKWWFLHHNCDDHDQCPILSSSIWGYPQWARPTIQPVAVVLIPQVRSNPVPAGDTMPTTLSNDGHKQGFVKLLTKTGLTLYETERGW